MKPCFPRFSSPVMHYRKYEDRTSKREESKCKLMSLDLPNKLIVIESVEVEIVVQL